jgi:hypothetical protein
MSDAETKDKDGRKNERTGPDRQHGILNVHDVTNYKPGLSNIWYTATARNIWEF